jgi:putative nucleotidyltransferase with HDIG domain
MSITDFKERMGDIPTLPQVASKINTESQKETFTVKSLGEIISQDGPLSSKILKLSNSAYYGLMKQVTTIDRAVTLLGANTIKNLALGVSIFKIISQGKSADIDLKGLWCHSLGCAVAAKALAHGVGQEIEEEAFLCGIIHDIGVFALVQIFPERMSTVASLIREGDLTQSEAEKKVFGFNHQEAGAILAESWNFPEKHFKGIRFHHNPFLPSIDPEEMDSKLVYAVYAGNEMAKAMHLGQSLDMKANGVKPDAWKVLGLTVKDVSVLRPQIKESFDFILQSWDLE